MTLVDKHGREITRPEIEAENAKWERLRAYDACSPKLRRVLVALADLGERRKLPAAPNDVAWECGYRPGMARSPRHGHHRTMGVAVHVTTALTALRRRGLVAVGGRRDGLSGTAYGLTELGDRVAATARAEGYKAFATPEEMTK